jgi:uncharacterized protein (TIGR02996 family)
MTDRDALYRAILAHPGDDTPRLVYADWLQENDRPEEAEFIRLGCRLEAEPPEHPDYVEWQARHDELSLWLGAHCPVRRPKLTGGLFMSGGESWWHVSRRGFPRYLEFEGNDRPGSRPIRALAAALEKAFAVLPTRWLVVRWVTVSQLAELLRQPVIEQLDTLTVQLRLDDEPRDDAARLIASSPNLRNLRGACLAFDVGEAGAAALARSEHLGRLEWLKLGGGSFTAAALRSLASSLWFRNLRSLALNDLAGHPAEEVFRAESFPELHSLELTGDALAPGGWRRLAESKAFPRLASLTLGRGAFDQGGVDALARPTGFRLARLDLGWNGIGNAGAAALASAPWLDSLHWLSLRGNLLGPAGVRAIAGSGRLTGLRHLDLAYNVIGAAGLRAIARNPALRGLVNLDLGSRPAENAFLREEHFRECLARLDMPRLRYLSLRGRTVSGRAARLLADERFGSLTRLILSGCGITDAAASVLLSSPALQNLTELGLADNRLKDGVAALADPRTLPRLASYELGGNHIPEALAKKLRRPGVKL